MQTILGANGQIAVGLAQALRRDHTDDLRLVSRHPRLVTEDDHLFAANLLDAEATSLAVEGSEVVYLTVGLPPSSQMWEDQFPTMMANTIDACERHGARLVFFDNTYMYPRTPDRQVEETAFEPAGRKSRVRADMALQVLAAMDAGRVEAMICRAPEFYGPDKTQSFTNSLVFDRIERGKRPLVPISAHTRRTLIWTPDASRAMALLGNTPDAYGQTWHLPVDPHRLTYAEMIGIASEVTGRDIGWTTVPNLVFTLGSLVSPEVRELRELLPRYRVDNVFDSTKFAHRFPDFEVTTYREGITELVQTAPVVH